MASKSIADEETLAEVASRLSELGPASKRKWGRMTAHQMVCHLADALRIALGDKPAPPRVDTWTSRNVIRRVALYAPLRWPQGIPTVQGIDQAAGEGTTPAVFESDRDALVQMHERLAAEATDRVHPIFGPLSRAEWLIWAYRHADHHLRQFGA